MFATSVSLGAGFLLESYDIIGKVALLLVLRFCSRVVFTYQYYASIIYRTNKRNRLSIKRKDGTYINVDRTVFRRYQKDLMEAYVQRMHDKLSVKLTKRLIPLTLGGTINVAVRVIAITWTAIYLILYTANWLDCVLIHIRSFSPYLGIYCFKLIPCLVILIPCTIYTYFLIIRVDCRIIAGRSSVLGYIILKTKGELPIYAVDYYRLKKNRFSVYLKLITWKTRKVCKKTIGACSEFIGRLPRRWKH